MITGSARPASPLASVASAHSTAGDEQVERRLVARPRAQHEERERTPAMYGSIDHDAGQANGARADANASCSWIESIDQLRQRRDRRTAPKTRRRADGRGQDRRCQRRRGSSRVFVGRSSASAPSASAMVIGATNGHVGHRLARDQAAHRARWPSTSAANTPARRLDEARAPARRPPQIAARRAGQNGMRSAHSARSRVGQLAGGGRRPAEAGELHRRAPSSQKVSTGLDQNSSRVDAASPATTG